MPGCRMMEATSFLNETETFNYVCTSYRHLHGTKPNAHSKPIQQSIKQSHHVCCIDDAWYMHGNLVMTSSRYVEAFCLLADLSWHVSF